MTHNTLTPPPDPSAANRREGSFLSNPSLASVRADQVALSFTDPNVARPIDLALERAQHRADQAGKPPPSVSLKMCVVISILVFSPGTVLWQQYFKTEQLAGHGPGCDRLWKKIEDGIARDISSWNVARTLEFVDLRRLMPDEDRRWGSGDWEDALDGFFSTALVRTSPEDVGPGDKYFDRELQDIDCSWYLVEAPRARAADWTWGDKERQICGREAVDPAQCAKVPGCRYLDGGEAGATLPGCYFAECDSAMGQTCFKRKLHRYAMGFSLCLVTILTLFVHWVWAYYQGGWDLFVSCFDWTKMSRFAVIGSLFGFSTVFGFFAQAAMTPGSYLIVGQTSIILVPFMWRVIFRTAIPTLSWLHIFMTGFGIYTYFTADMDFGDSGGTSVTGLFFAIVKVMMAGLAAVMTDLYLKTLQDIPFPVQVSYTIPFKALSCLLTDFLLPPHCFPPADIRRGGPFHDWNFGVVMVLAFTFGNAIATGIVVNVFDAVAKSVIAVMSIVFPTWIVSYALGWEIIEFASAEGKLKVTGATFVVLSGLAYTFGRAVDKRLSTQADHINELERQSRRWNPGGRMNRQMKSGCNVEMTASK